MSDTSYGEHGKASKGGKGAKKKDLEDAKLPVDWVKNVNKSASVRLNA